MKNIVSKFMNDESGATAIEYGLIAALIGVAIIAAAGLVGDGLDDIFRKVSGELEKAAEAPGSGS